MRYANHVLEANPCDAIGVIISTSIRTPRLRRNPKAEIPPTEVVIENPAELSAPAARGRRRKIVNETDVVQPLLEPVAVVAPEIVKPKAKGRPKKQLPSSEADVPLELGAPVEPIPETSTPSEVPPLKKPTEVLQLEKPVKTRKKAVVTETVEKPKARVRGKNSKTPEPETAIQLEDEGFAEPTEPITQINPETLEIIPEAPAAKKLVRLRREAREHVFSHQGALHNPLEAVLEYFRANNNGFNSRELSAELDDVLQNRLGGRKGIEEALIELEQIGYLSSIRKGTFQATRELTAVVGKLEIRQDNSGWFTPETPGLRPMLIPANALLFAWSGDRVVARELRRNGHSEGEVIRVLERVRNTMTGTLEYQRGYAVLRPDQANLPSVVLDSTALLASGTRILADVLYPEDTGEDEAVARVREILGDSASLNAERAALIARLELPNPFSSAALSEASKLGTITAKDLKGRIDLRAKRVFALPGLELAVQIEPLGNGNVLLAVHYADAGYWIDENTALEAAILERGAHVNLRGETLSILPEVLLAQLRFETNTERLALSVLIETTADGGVVNYVVRPSVISIAATLSGANQTERDLFMQIGGVERTLNLANHLSATLISGAEITALYRTPGNTSFELPSALERSSGFDQNSLVVQTLKTRLTEKSKLLAAESTEGNQQFCLEQPLGLAADFLNVRILGWCATKLSQRKREHLKTSLPTLTKPLELLEQRAVHAATSLEQFEMIKTLPLHIPMRGVVIGIDQFALELVLEQGAIGRLLVEDLGEEVTYSPNQWKTRLGRVFKLGSIVRVVVESTRPATREARLCLYQKESNMTRLRRRKPGASTANAVAGSKTTVGKSPTRRGVVVLGNRPRAEYPRPVRITARKLYFGEWSREKFAELEGDNPEFEVTPRTNTHRPHQPRHQDTRPARSPDPRGQRPQGQHQPRRPHPQQQRTNNPVAAAVTPTTPPTTAQPDLSRNSRIEQLRQRQLQALERNANRAQHSPAPSAPSSDAVVAGDANRRPKRRPQRHKPPAA